MYYQADRMARPAELAGHFLAGREHLCSEFCSDDSRFGVVRLASLSEWKAKKS